VVAIAASLGFQVRTGTAVGGSPFTAATEDEARLPQRVSGVGAPLVPASAGAVRVAGIASRASVRSCPFDRQGLVFYRVRYSHHRRIRGLETEWPPGRKPRNCADAHYLAELWPTRSFAERQITERWVDEHTLEDFAYDDGNHAWFKAIAEVQVLFPGTEAWLISCSRPEGGHGRWVGYDGVAYSDGLRDSNTVGGNMQFRFGTFTGMWRHAVEYALELGYRLPRHLIGDSLVAKTRAWRSALGQAMAAGWARFTGSDDQHWSASWDRGCR
jgi:hypothetical protein